MVLGATKWNGMARLLSKVCSYRVVCELVPDKSEASGNMAKRVLGYRDVRLRSVVELTRLGIT